MKDASSTMMNPSRLNWVDSNVNINRPLEISRTTRIRNGFWSRGTEERETVRNRRKRLEDEVRKIRQKTDMEREKWSRS